MQSEYKPFPLSVFGVTLGLAGLAGAWVAAYALLGAPRWPAEVLYGLGGAFWLIFTISYLARGLPHPVRFRADLTHLGSGPFTALIPAVGILLASHYTQYFPNAGRWVTIAFVLVLAAVAGQLIAHWLSGNIRLEALNGGYFIAVVAAPFIASIGLTTIGFHAAALGAFGIGLFFWLSFGTIVMSRHMMGGALPPAAAPSTSAFLAAPASGGVAWIIAHGGTIDEPLILLTGVLFVMLLVQLILIGRYRKIPFSLSFWTFAFPAASTTNYLVRWLAASQFDGWRVLAWCLLAIATVFIATIGVASIVFEVRGRLSRRDAR